MVGVNFGYTTVVENGKEFEEEIERRRNEIRGNFVQPISFTPEPNEYDDIPIEELIEI